MNNLIQFLSLPLDDVVPTPVAAQPPGTEKVATLLGWGKWIGLAMQFSLVEAKAVNMLGLSEKSWPP